jgi:hypothetical protein
MARRDFYENNAAKIKRVADGFVLTIFLGKGLNRDMEILITDEGEMIGFDGPVIRTDLGHARVLLRHIGEHQLGEALRIGDPNPTLIKRVKANLSR